MHLVGIIYQNICYLAFYIISEIPTNSLLGCECRDCKFGLIIQSVSEANLSRVAQGQISILAHIPGQVFITNQESTP